MTEVKKLTIMFMAAIVTVVAFVSSASAAAPSPNYGTGITVDETIQTRILVTITLLTCTVPGT